MKRCSSCKIEKSLSEFHKNAGQKDGFHNQCVPCKSKYKPSPEQIKRNKEKTTILTRLKWSGFTNEEYLQKLSEQDNKCAICKSDNPNHADHNHEDGTKRGILCKKCNTGIAYLKENIEVLEEAIKYLKHYTR